MARTRIINEGGEVACEHRDLSVCQSCWDETPGLVNVYEVCYRWQDGAGWTADEVAQISAGEMENVSLSPGTVAAPVAS